MREFAKIYEFEDIGQVLVKIDTNEYDAPEVRIFCCPPELGVCNFAFSFEDSDDGWVRAENLFGKMTEHDAYGLAEDTMELLADGAPYGAQPCRQRPTPADSADSEGA